MFAYSGDLSTYCEKLSCPFEESVPSLATSNRVIFGAFPYATKNISPTVPIVA
ncbi:MAG: hypothetical protein ABEL76_16110 [Bradymonadaceae bacterium]